ncbi:MAG: flagellar biosynthesis anti-sigma factor FlgM [Candidatus Sulfotelmatobacter sp.]|jgi:flagellar biosynthesis anti-sigma factor FlgM
MKIDLSGSTPDPMITSRGNHQDATSTSQVHNAGGDTTSLSYDRANIGSLTSQALSSADVRQDKVDALRQAIGSGQYKVVPNKIAEGMLQEYPE